MTKENIYDLGKEISNLYKIVDKLDIKDKIKKDELVTTIASINSLIEQALRKE